MITRGINEIKITTKYNKYVFTKEYDILEMEIEITGRYLIVRRMKVGDFQEIYFLLS